MLCFRDPVDRICFLFKSIVVLQILNSAIALGILLNVI